MVGITLGVLEEVGFRLPKGVYQLYESKRGTNPKTGGRFYLSRNGDLYSWDRQEEHLDVLHRNGTYDTVSLDGRVLKTKKSTIRYSTVN